jgi:bifunctional polynucleotide phosphatase/kinase
MPGMWSELERIFAQDGITIGHFVSLWSLNHWLILLQDKNDSYFVGDAAGRADDFASTDRKFALNVGIQFYTPEVRHHSYGWEAHLELISGIFPQNLSSIIYSPRIPRFVS